MARIKPRKRAIAHTLTWDYPESGMHLSIEMRQVPARQWFDTAESRDPAWQVTENAAEGYITALRPVLTLGS